MSIWTTEDGRKIPVVRMSDSHLRNAYRMLKRKGFVSPARLDDFMAGPQPRGDMAQMAWDDELNAHLDSRTSDFIDIFEDEAKRRNLEL